MSGSNSEQGSKNYSGPTYAQQQYQSDLLDPFMREMGLNTSPWYGQLSQAYNNMLGQANYQIPPYASKTIEEMVSTGSPFNESEVYKSAKPVFQREMNEAMASAKESSGQAGQLRSSGGYQALGEAAAGSAEDFNKYLTEVASSSWESAQNRRASAIPYAFQEQTFGPEMLSMLSSLSQALSEGKYPMLPQAMMYSGAGQPISVGSSYGKSGGGGLSCCFIFIEGEGELTQTTRDYRDEHYLDSPVAIGYKRMAKWLVPLMKRNKFIKNIIRLTMTQPLGKYADYFYGKNNYGWLFYPTKIWTLIWNIYGRRSVCQA